VYRSEDILMAAQTLSPYLAALLGPAPGQAVQADLQALLARAAAGEADMHTAILELLARHERSREWLARFLGSEGATKSFAQAPTTRVDVKADEYFCPVCGARDFQHSAGEKMVCTADRTEMVPLRPIQERNKP
jgi:NADH pyrophosphatase NudC (nudix superfamily)